MNGVAQLHDVVYVVSQKDTLIKTFHATTHQRLADIDVSGSRMLSDIAACELTCQLYVSDREPCIWRMSSDGR